MSDNNSQCKENALAQNRCNSLSYTFRTSKIGRAIKELVFCWTFDHIVMLMYKQSFVQKETENKNSWCIVLSSANES